MINDVTNKKPYEIYKGLDLKLAEKIQRRRLQILVHSCIYYQMDQNIVTDFQYNSWAKELEELQGKYPDISKNVKWAKEFENYSSSTGFNLPVTDPWVMNKAKQLLVYKGLA